MKTDVADASLPFSYPDSAVKVAGDFTAEVDAVDEATWYDLCRNFADANIYQTWPYGVARSGRTGISHLIIKGRSEAVAAAQVRLALIPGLNLGMAYVFWGPLWRRSDNETNLENFRHALRSLRSEYVGRRKLVLRVVPNLSETEPVQRIFAEEGFLPQPRGKRRRTILMDVRPTMEELYRGLHQKWRNCLHKARKQGLEMIEGDEDALFEGFTRIHAQMRERKNLGAMTDPALYRRIQVHLLPTQKLRVFLCRASGELCAGAIGSALGDTGIYLFGATNELGMRTCASYLVHWRMLEWVKSRGCLAYDLNGINPTKNPGVYQFKSRLAGAHERDIHLLGVFDAYPNLGMKLLVSTADSLVSGTNWARNLVKRFVR